MHHSQQLICNFFVSRNKVNQRPLNVHMKRSALCRKTSRECTWLWVLSCHHCNGRPDFKETNLYRFSSSSRFPLLLTFASFMSTPTCEKAKRTLDFCVDNKKGPFGSRLLVKLQLGKENKREKRRSYMLQNSKNLRLIFFHEDTVNQQRLFLCLSPKIFSMLRGNFLFFAYTPKQPPSYLV